MPAAEPFTESPQLKRERIASLVAIALVLLTLPALVLLIHDTDESQNRINARWFAWPAIAAMVFVSLYWSRWRMTGFIPWAAFAWLLAAAHGVYWHEWPPWAHGISIGIIIGAASRGRCTKTRWWEYPIYLIAVVVGIALAFTFREREQPTEWAGWFVLGATIALTCWAWVRMFRQVFELTLEPVLWVMYRVRWTGPGFSHFPRTGPCLVIANHACWLDPIFLAKVLPRPVTPMMTSKFYDLPVLRWLMVGFGIIRVPDVTWRRDAPELQEAVAALDRGECVVIFPEGFLRRKEEQPLRRFGQGAWAILQARPNTPVFATWIEGGWGSYTSHRNGPPMKNKKKDFRRPIGVGMSSAITVPPGLLESHLKTRTHLMNLVGEARKHLQLEPLPPFTLPEKAEEESSEKD